jgi:hypothetical protein
MNNQQSRRRFLKQSELTTIGITSGLKSFGAPYGAGVTGSNVKIRVGFIGVYKTDNEFYRTGGGIFYSMPHYESMFEPGQTK